MSGGVAPGTRKEFLVPVEMHGGGAIERDDEVGRHGHEIGAFPDWAMEEGRHELGLLDRVMGDGEWTE